MDLLRNDNISTQATDPSAVPFVLFRSNPHSKNGSPVLAYNLSGSTVDTKLL